MEEYIDTKVNKFETILKTYSAPKSLLYSDRINERTSQSLKSEIIIDNIARQISALNNNEILKNTVNNKIKAFKKSRLTSVNMITLEPQHNPLVVSTFDHQCEYDTQLLLATKDAEAITNLGIGVTQEFETSFDHKANNPESSADSNTDNKNTGCDELKIDRQNQLIQESIPSICELKHLVEHKKENQKDTDVYDITITSSPILVSKEIKCEHNTSFLLESFERFEAIAAPIVQENNDIDIVKKIINLKMLHDSKPQLTSEHKQCDDKGCETNSIQLSPILNLKTNQEEIKKHSNCDLHDKDVVMEEKNFFSSDEENSNDNAGEPLPLTCALQTSFYEEEHVLDKTIFVGFQTASNKSIQVLTDSFKRAKSILNDCDDTKKPTSTLSLSELVEVYDSTTKEKRGDNILIKTSFVEGCKTGKNENNNMIYNYEKASKLHKSDHLNEIVPLPLNAVVCTQEQTKIDDYMMQEFEENLCIDDNKLHTNSKLYNQPVIFNNDEQPILNNNKNAHSNQFRVQTLTLINKEETQENVEDKNETDKTDNNDEGLNQLFAGFKTASNKCINISKEALVKSIKILDEVNFQNSLKADECDSKISFTRDMQNKHINENENKNKKQPFEDTNNDVNVQLGFITASNVPINVSKEAFLKSKKFLQEFQCDKDIVINNENEASQKKETLKLVTEKYYDFGSTDCKLTVMEETISKCNRTQQNFNVKKEFYQGFKTASNKPISISEEGLKKSRKILEDISLIKNGAGYYNDESKKDENISNENIEDGKYNEKKSSSSLTEKSFSNNSANSKRIIDLGEEIGNNNFNKEFTKASYKRAKTSKEENSKNIIENGSPNQGYNFKESHTVLNNEFSGLCSSKNTFEGFMTASNNHVMISDEALEKSKNIYQDIRDYNNLDQFKYPKSEFGRLTSTKNGFQGFKTASNNPVQVSDEALEKSKKIFQNMEDYSKCDLITFKTHSKELSESKPLKNTFQGFKTASNNLVKISDAALEKSKKIFQDIDSYNNNCDSVTYKAHGEQQSGLNNLKDTFQGFMTASNNPVKISNDALEKTKKNFQDIGGNNVCNNNFSDKQVIQNIEFNKVDIETADNKKHVYLSKETTEKSNHIIEDMDNNFKTKIKQKLNYEVASRQVAPVKSTTNNLVNKEDRIPLNVDVSNIFNTEVMNDFNDTMLTEDFLNKTPSNKRSGSPILSCPRAKKMKIMSVIRSELKEGSPIAIKQSIEKSNQFVFNVNYKKQKKYTLLDVSQMDKVSGIIQSFKEVNYSIDNILYLEFVGSRNEISNSKWTITDIKICFLELVNRNIIPKGWIENHLKLITLKLLSYEKRFPNCMKNICSVCNILEQLNYRYKRELYNVERPALRKILEKDEVPSRRMVLQVLNIYKDGVSVTNSLNSTENIELLLSDGWYCVKATLDKMLTRLVCEGKITVRTKLVTHGAELLNCEHGVAPWEDTSAVRLKIFGNSTRRAHWAAKLGFHANGAILSYLSTVKPEGGKTSRLRVIITRVYPLLYVEKFDDGSTVTRSERLENLHQMKYEMERETMLEKIYEEVEKEFCMQASQCDSMDDDRKSLESGSQIYQMLKNSRDPTEFRAGLTHTQAKILQEYVDRRREISLQDLQSKVQNVLKKRGLNITRNVVAMLKIRVADVYKQNVTKAMITVWRPHESLLHLLREGIWLDIHNVVPTAVRYSEIQISAGKQSLFRKTSKVNDKMLNIARTFQRKCYLIQELTQNPFMTTDYNEVDTVGFVFDVQPPVEEFDCKKQLFQNVFLADANKKIICINFWGGLKKFGFDNILEIEQVVACVNLQKRSGNTRKNIPQYRATEFTYFTRTPKIDVCRKVCEHLSKQFLTLDRRKFVQDCIMLRNNLVNMKYGNIENISPYRFNNSDYNLSKNKIFINSPNGDPNLNLNGLDFDSTFKQSDTALSPKALLRKKEISERIAKLRRYGEPPPLGSIHIVNKSRDAVKPYRSPLISKIESNNDRPKGDDVASAEPQTVSSSVVNTPGDNKSRNDRCTSPVLPFPRKTVNPVRLNFSKHNDVSGDDPFGEDFEASPPLSLD